MRSRRYIDERPRYSMPAYEVEPIKQLTLTKERWKQQCTNDTVGNVTVIQLYTVKKKSASNTSSCMKAAAVAVKQETAPYTPTTFLLNSATYDTSAGHCLFQTSHIHSRVGALMIRTLQYTHNVIPLFHDQGPTLPLYQHHLFDV